MGDEVTKNLQQKPLGHLSFVRQLTAGHRPLCFQLGQLQGGPHGIGNSAREFHRAVHRGCEGHTVAQADRALQGVKLRWWPLLPPLGSILERSRFLTSSAQKSNDDSRIVNQITWESGNLARFLNI